jgi:hypothetical protein
MCLQTPSNERRPLLIHRLAMLSLRVPLTSTPALLLMLMASLKMMPCAYRHLLNSNPPLIKFSRHIFKLQTPLNRPTLCKHLRPMTRCAALVIGSSSSSSSHVTLQDRKASASVFQRGRSTGRDGRCCAPSSSTRACTGVTFACRYRRRAQTGCVSVRCHGVGCVCDGGTGGVFFGTLPDSSEIWRRTRWLPHTSHLIPHTSHLTPHTSHLTPHTSHLTPHTSHLTPHTSHLTPHTSHLTPHTSHLTPHTSHLTPHTSHLTPHTSHLPAAQRQGLRGGAVLHAHTRQQKPRRHRLQVQGGSPCKCCRAEHRVHWSARA